MATFRGRVGTSAFRLLGSLLIGLLVGCRTAAQGGPTPSAAAAAGSGSRLVTRGTVTSPPTGIPRIERVMTANLT